MTDLSSELLLARKAREQRRVVVAGRDRNRIERLVVRFLSVHFLEMNRPPSRPVVVVAVRYVDHFSEKADVLL